MAYIECNGGGAGIKKLWTGTAREYAQNSSISVDLSKYKKILIKFLSDGRSESTYKFEQVFDISNGSHQRSVIGMAYNSSVVSEHLISDRDVTVSNTGLSLGQAHRYYSTSASQNVNYAIIPIEIYGIKSDEI